MKQSDKERVVGHLVMAKTAITHTLQAMRETKLGTTDHGVTLEAIRKELHEIAVGIATDGRDWSR